MRFLAVLATLCVASADFSQLQSSLTFVEGLDAGHSVEFTVTNPTAESISVPLHLTPLNGISADIFEIVGAQGEVEYIGMLAKRVEAEMLTIAAGQTFSTVVDLSMDYKFERPGFFKATWRFGQAETTAFETTEAFGDRRFGSQDMNISSEAPNNFQGCTATERTQVLSADVAATSDARNSHSCLSSNSCASRYVTWFGTRTDARYSTTTRNFNAIQGEFNRGSYRIHCNPSSCQPNVYAFVYPTDRTHVIYLCSVFWRLPNERAETLVHEMSHFNDVASTRDFAYGQTPCKNLARSNPANAIANADNLCYFAHGYTL